MNRPDCKTIMLFGKPKKRPRLKLFPSIGHFTGFDLSGRQQLIALWVLLDFHCVHTGPQSGSGLLVSCV